MPKKKEPQEPKEAKETQEAMTALDAPPLPLPVATPQTEDVPVGIISPDRFEDKIKALRASNRIKNDAGVDVNFEGESKEEFLQMCEQSYPIIARHFETIYEMGEFLHEVRTRLRPHRLYYSFLEVTGMPERTARNYVQTYERFRDRLPQFAYLGIKKLLIVSRLDDCVEYVQEHEEAIAAQTAEQLVQQVKARRKKAVPPGKKPRGRKPTCITVGECKMWHSTDGTKLRIEGLTETQAKEIIKAVKSMVFHTNE